jgi:SAM-dependent methyltransferase
MGELRRSEAGRVLAPVSLAAEAEDSVTHSLRVLATVYHYNHWIFSLIRDDLGPSVLEVGAGTGNITQFLLNAERLVCLEPYGPYREYLARRFEKHLNVAIVARRIEECPAPEAPEGAFDSVVCLNVLEHLEDDADVLARFRRLARPGGKVIVLVPAWPFLYGAMDRAMGHRRRYTLGGLRRAFLAAGLRPVRWRRVNFLGALGWWWRGRVRRKETIPEAQTRLFDRMVPVLSAIERIIPPPFGQTVLVVGEADGPAPRS